MYKTKNKKTEQIIFYPKQAINDKYTKQIKYHILYAKRLV